MLDPSYELWGDKRPLVRREQILEMEKHHQPPELKGMAELLARRLG